MSVSNEFPNLIIGLCVFVILFVVIQKAIKTSKMFHWAISPIIALCVTVLSMLGLNQDLLYTKTTTLSGDQGFNLILISYEVLAISILIVIILKYILGRSKTDRNKLHCTKNNSDYKNLPSDDRLN